MSRDISKRNRDANGKYIYNFLILGIEAGFKRYDGAMGLTLSHTSALHAMRLVRSEGVDVREMGHVALAKPTPWRGKRWTTRAFAADTWAWQVPSEKNPLHVLVGSSSRRIRLRTVNCHVSGWKLPAHAVLLLDERTSTVSPELLFLQMSDVLSLQELVMLGYELCGCFSRDANNPLDGPVTDKIAPATTVEEISRMVAIAGVHRQTVLAEQALDYIADHAVSVPEAVLATMYSLPPKELGYGMGPVTLNQRVRIGDDEDAPSRYPDLMLGFAPVGINYDGEMHLDLAGLVAIAREAERAEGDEAAWMSIALAEKLAKVRAKVVDDTARNRQLASRGKLVFPMTKENLYGKDNLDRFTREILQCAHALFGTDTSEYEKVLNDTSLCKERYEMLSKMLSSKGS